MSRSRSRLAADWFAKLRVNAGTQAVEHEDVEVVDAATTTALAAKADTTYVNTAISNIPPSNNASALTTGTLPDGRFPATLPAVSGVNLTGLVTDPTMGGDLSGTASNAQIVANAVTDTELNSAKLNGIEAGATADQTGAEILALFSNSITAGHIAANAIGASELNSNVVNSEHYVDGSIDRVHLANDIIDGSKIANDVINSEHYVAGSIDNEHIADNAINSEHYADNSIDALHLNVSGNGTTSQYLRSDGDGSFSWVTPPNTNTTYSAGTGLDLSGTTFSIESDLREGGTGSDRYWGNTHDYIFADASHGLRFYTAGAEDMRLENNGNLHVDGNITAYSTTISDRNLKTDIKNIDNALDKVNKLNGCTFTYTSDGKESAGLIAQEVEEVLPSAVTTSQLVFHGEEGKEYKVLQYDQTIGLLVEAIKELSVKVEELENK